MPSQPPRIPETFEDITRALNLLNARTIPGRLNADGEVHLQETLGAMPTVEEAPEWYATVSEALRRLRESGGEPAEPPQIPKTAKQLKAAIDLLAASQQPGGISSRTARVRLHQMMGGIFPSPATAARWQSALETRLERMLNPRGSSGPSGGKKFDKKRPSAGGAPAMKGVRPEPTVAVTRRPVSDKLRPKTSS